MNENAFSYTYSASENQEVLRIRQKSLPKEKTKLEDLKRLGLWAIRLQFTTETSIECVQILERYLGKGRYQPNDFTRGLYYRGVE